MFTLVAGGQSAGGNRVWQMLSCSKMVPCCYVLTQWKRESTKGLKCAPWQPHTRTGLVPQVPSPSASPAWKAPLLISSHYRLAFNVSLEGGMTLWLEQ